MIRVGRIDITHTPADVVVNSANPSLGGIGPELPEGVGGVDGAIHRCAGIDLWRYLQGLPIRGELKPGWSVRCWPGRCVVTPGFRLAARYIVHGVAPVFDPSAPCECFAVLTELYKNIFDAITSLEHRTVLVPPIGTRSYGFPMQESAKIALGAARSFVEATGSDLEFCVVVDEERRIYRKLLGMDASFGRL